MGVHICITNPRAWLLSREIGIYGNVGDNDDNANVTWGKLRDLYAIKPGDFVIFYVKEIQEFFGVYQVNSHPYVCYDNIFDDNNEFYPFRFNFTIVENFSNSIPAFEFYSLIEQGKLTTIFTVEKDVNSTYRGIRQISELELAELRNVFYKYNPKSNPNFIDFIPPNENYEYNEIEAIEFSSVEELDTPTIIKFNRIPFEKRRRKNIARYENVLHACISNNLLENTNNIRTIFDLEELSELILEAPILKSQQHRGDILIQFNRNNHTVFYSFLELKRQAIINTEELSQLIGYLRSFANTRKLSRNSYEGIFVAPTFTQKLINYLHQRKEVEKEDIVKLVEYNIQDDGFISFNRI